MDKLKTFTYCIESKKNSKGLCPIRIRFTVNGGTVNLTTGVQIDAIFWDKKKAKVKAKHPKCSQLNKEIKELEDKIQGTWEDLKYRGEPISALKIKKIIRNETVTRITLIYLIKYHIAYIKERVGKQYSSSTLKQFVTLKNKIERFLIKSYSSNDLDIERVNYEFITRFEAFLSTVDENSINTTTKYIKRLKTVINTGIKNEWITSDPFLRYRGKTEPTNRQHLSFEEIKEIENLDLNENERLDMVRDSFLFMAYTGLAYCDLLRVNKNNIIIGLSGKKFIRIERGKTKQICEIPIFDKTADLIEKYKSNPFCINKNVLIPVISNQKTNFYLKQIAEKAKIQKPITCHIGRYCFATLSLELNVPLETVSKVLGHRSIKTTQIYGKITRTKIESDYENMSQIFGGNNHGKKKVG